MQLQPDTWLQDRKYKIIRTLGQGGFGITYEAEQVNLGRTVAIKEFFMKDCCDRDAQTGGVSVGTGSQRELVEKFRGKFIREARMLASFNHRHIVRVIDVFEENGTAYYVMENLPGGSLAAKVKKDGALPEPVAEKYIRQVAEALAYVHSRNTVHLDVKPANILLNEDGDAVLIDFGISKHYDAAGEQTSSTPVGVSKGYAPHEQSLVGDVSQFRPSTDIYSLGATLFYLLTGTVPPDASLVLDDGLERPKVVSDRMWNVIRSSMQPKRKDRPQSIAEFLSLFDKANPSRPAEPEEDEDTVMVPGALPKPGPKTGSDRAPVPIVGSGSEPKPSREPKPKHEPKPARNPKPAPDPRPKPASASKRKPWLWALLAGAAALAVVLYFMLGGRSHTIEDYEYAVEEPLESTDVSSVATSGITNGHEWVDLGLSVKWATCNVGASSPSDYGDYFAWGEIRTKSSYDMTGYRFRTSGNDSDRIKFSKYNTTDKHGTIDNKSTLDPEDDVASRQWGDSWRMPTKEEWQELLDQCSWTWTSRDGVNGYLVSRQQGSIFLPAGGDWTVDYFGGASSGTDGGIGHYWSSNVFANDSYEAVQLSFNRAEHKIILDGRWLGFSVRPVIE